MFLLVGLIVLLASNVKLIVEGCEEDECFDCDKLEEQMVDGKWLSYNMVLTNCFVKRFFEKSQENVDFYVLLSNLKDTVERYSKSIEQDFNQTYLQRKEKLGSSKFELEIKASKRKLEQSKMRLLKVVEDANIQVALIESEIRDLMDRCLRPPRLGRDLVLHKDICTSDTDKTFVRVKDLCQRLKAQLAFIGVDALRLKINQNTIQQHQQVY